MTEAAVYDRRHLTKFEQFGGVVLEAFQAFMGFHHAAFAAGAISLKHKELMAVAVALTTQCPYCIEAHTNFARKAGATERELAEATMVAAAIRAGGAVAHGSHTLE